MSKTGPCSTKNCHNRGERAHGARDIEGFASRHPQLFKPSYYCDECVAAAAQRVLSTSISLRGRRALGEGKFEKLVTTLPGDAGRDELF